MQRLRFEGSVLEIREQRQGRVYPHVGDQQFAHNAAQMFSRTRTARRTITYDPRRFVVPCFAREIQGVFQCTGNAVVILLHDEHKSIQLVELLVPRCDARF
ncbi:hypothetical protein D3C76_1639860 [compost metagenome]